MSEDVLCLNDISVLNTLSLCHKNIYSYSQRQGYIIIVSICVSVRHCIYISNNRKLYIINESHNFHTMWVLSLIGPPERLSGTISSYICTEGGV